MSDPLMKTIEKLNDKVDELKLRVEKLLDSVNFLCWERSCLASLLTTHYSSGIQTVSSEPTWQRFIVVDFPWGQGRWHIPNEHMDLIKHIPDYLGDYYEKFEPEQYPKMTEYIMGWHMLQKHMSGDRGVE